MTSLDHMINSDLCLPDKQVGTTGAATASPSNNLFKQDKGKHTRKD